MAKPSIPDPLNSESEYARFNHFDIPELDNSELTDELNYVKAHLWGVPRDDWQRQRVKVLETELRNRRAKT